MKYLTDRHEIAKAMNFGKHPVLYINMENRPFAELNPDSDYAVGCRVRVHWDSNKPGYQDMYSNGQIYHSGGEIKIGSEGACLKADFCREDVIAMYHLANIPMIHKGDTVVVVEDYPGKKMCKVRVMKMPDRFDRFCQTMCALEDID